MTMIIHITAITAALAVIWGSIPASAGTLATHLIKRVLGPSEGQETPIKSETDQ